MAMAEARRQPPTQSAEPPAKHVDPPPSMNQLALEHGDDRNKSIVPVEPKENAGALTVVDGALNRSGQQSPDTFEKKNKITPGKRGTNLKAEAFAVARNKRVEEEVQTYIDSEVRKAEAQKERQKAIAEKEKLREQTRAVEKLKKEEQRAELVVQNAIVQAEKLVAQAKDKSALIKANAKEASERQMAEAATRCESNKAAADEGEGKKMAEIKDSAEVMLASGELITADHKRSVAQRMKQHLVCFHV